MSAIKTSLLSANYNNSEYLVDYFDSILASSKVPDQVVFVDDCSTDISLEIAKQYENRLNLVIVKLSKNVGFANALNIGLELCDGDIIFRLDPDDYVHPNRFELQLSFFEKNASLSVVGTQAQYVDSSSKKNVRVTDMPTKERILKAYHNADNGVLHGTVAVKASVYKEYSYSQQDVPSEDYALFAKMINDGYEFDNIDRALTFVRVHSASVSNSIRYDTVKKVFYKRREVFLIDYSTAHCFFAYVSIKFYRHYLYSGSFFRYFYLFVAAIFGFDKVIRKLKSMTNER